LFHGMAFRVTEVVSGDLLDMRWQIFLVLFFVFHISLYAGTTGDTDKKKDCIDHYQTHKEKNNTDADDGN